MLAAHSSVSWKGCLFERRRLPLRWREACQFAGARSTYATGVCPATRELEKAAR
jgi:hypothetical protein